MVHLSTSVFVFRLYSIAIKRLDLNVEKGCINLVKCDVKKKSRGIILGGFLFRKITLK